MFVLVHQNSRGHTPCKSSCKSWRKAILDKPNDPPVETSGYSWNDVTLTMDRFCIKCIPPREQRYFKLVIRGRS
ncbi:hypothetical protein FA13DRAFT_1729097 [Coprinellus micaceus]|uniref:Uncharacterized protein n=1 Tax=Coprinellus micaceus TaxID=71717 RepID=A0A4Y7TKF1_COPMI|nr:hypothetical protein FA13DRAFT_1729097 [Coprinellus micaceus]